MTSLLVVFACNNSRQKFDKVQGWTEQQKRLHFYHNFSGFHDVDEPLDLNDTTTFADFFKTQYPDIKAKNIDDPFPYAFEEEYIDTTRFDPSRHWFRLIVLPCFRKPYCFTVEEKDGRTILTTKITNGDGGYGPGQLIATLKFPSSNMLYDSIANELKSVDFWKLGVDRTCRGGFDGESWTFESIESGKYNIIRRWLPQNCGNSTTIRLSKIGLKLGKLSKLDNILTAIGATKSGM